MIPLLMKLELSKGNGRILRLWIPLFLLWLLLLPLAILLSPLVLLACLVTWINPLRLGAVCWEILASLKGTHIEVREAQRIFQLEVV